MNAIAKAKALTAAANDATIAFTADRLCKEAKSLFEMGFLSAPEALAIADILDKADTRHLLARKAETTETTR